VNRLSEATGDAVLVTGSSTGLGLETALHLAARGFVVYAGVESDGMVEETQRAALERNVCLDVIQLDITQPADVERAMSRIQRDGRTLYGLVNNAGIGLRGCLEDLADAEIRRVFDVNVLGTFGLTRRAVADMRPRRRGRIVTISSVGGRIASFGLSAYCATKFALEGFAEALALEVEPFGLRSIIIEPGIVFTSRWTVNRGLAAGANSEQSPYRAMFARAESLADRVAHRSRTQPQDVAEAVRQALTSRNPRMRYVVGRPAAAAIALRRYVPNRVFERFYFGTLQRMLVAA
jgi:NAD(P)-dependent dehydrogenase (short-subunit alcohol dehydrogenase family)